jgi:hypothetical protein
VANFELAAKLTDTERDIVHRFLEGAADTAVRRSVRSGAVLPHHAGPSAASENPHDNGIYGKDGERELAAHEVEGLVG